MPSKGMELMEKLTETVGKFLKSGFLPKLNYPITDRLTGYTFALKGI